MAQRTERLPRRSKERKQTRQMIDQQDTKTDDTENRQDTGTDIKAVGTPGLRKDSIQGQLIKKTERTPGQIKKTVDTLWQIIEQWGHQAEKRQQRWDARTDIRWNRRVVVCWLLNVPATSYSVYQGRIYSDNFTCCHTEIEVADQTFYLTQSQYTDTGPTSPSADPITPGAWQGNHWSANF